MTDTKFTCDECGEQTERRYEFKERVVCRECFQVLDFYRLLHENMNVKVFVDSYSKKYETPNGGKESAVINNIMVIDIENVDFRIFTRKVDSKNTYDGIYDAILFICDYIDDHHSVTIYTSSKIVINHVQGIYKAKSIVTKRKFHVLEKHLKKGLKIEYVCSSHNFARTCPNNFNFYVLFEDYDRGMHYLVRDKKMRETDIEGDDVCYKDSFPGEDDDDDGDDE